MINFFGKSTNPPKSTSSSNGDSLPPKKKPRTSSSSAPAVTVTTTRKVVARKPDNAPPKDSIAAISGYRPINALSEEKRRRIIEDRLAAEAEKAKAQAVLAKPIRSNKGSRAGSVASDTAPSKRAKPKKKRPVLSSDDEDFGGTRPSSRAPSTPRGSKRHSVDPHATDSYQKLGREGVASHYLVPRNILAVGEDSSSGSLQDQPVLSGCIPSSSIILDNLKGYGPFFNGLGDSPRATLEYPARGQSEEYLLLVPKESDEYDPILELLSTVKAIVSNYLTPEQRQAFGSLDSLEISSNAGMILGGRTASTLNGTRAKSAELLEQGSTKAERQDQFGIQGTENGLHTPQPETPPNASPAPTSYTDAKSTSVSPVKAALLSSAAAPAASGSSTPIHLDSPMSSQSTSAADPDPILRSFTKARNRRDGPLFLRTLARFNAELKRLKDAGEIEANIRQMGSEQGVPEGVWRLVQDQVYARTVGPRVEELGRYQAFSDNVYGELLPRFMSEIAQLTSLGPGKVFVDLGSGVGNLLIQTSLQTGCEAYGCEMMPIPAGLAQKQIEEATKRWKMWGLRGGPNLEAWEGDFGEHDKVREILRRADVVLVNK